MVGLSIYLLAVSALQEAEMQVSVQMYFRQFWRDPRLQYDARGQNRMLFGQETLNKEIDSSNIDGKAQSFEKHLKVFAKSSVNVKWCRPRYGSRIPSL